MDEPTPHDTERTPEQLKEGVVEVLKTVYDPEIPVDIYELGLIYEVEVDPERCVSIRMTLADVKLDLVWDPPWNPGMMSEAARLELGMV
jgi:metal-sulfur cluster biosynthetic enzyme